MHKPFRFLGAAFCVFSIALTGNPSAGLTAEALDSLEEQVEQTAETADNEEECRLFFVKRNLGLQVASMQAGEPIDTLHLFITNPQQQLIKDAQVIVTVIDEQGSQRASRALPMKGGYQVAIDHLPAGRYLAEAEIATGGRLLANLFRFAKG